jgi:hypothetical protein
VRPRRSPSSRVHAGEPTRDADRRGFQSSARTSTGSRSRVIPRRRIDQLEDLVAPDGVDVTAEAVDVLELADLVGDRVEPWRTVDTASGATPAASRSSTIRRAVIAATSGIGHRLGRDRFGRSAARMLRRERR